MYDDGISDASTISVMHFALLVVCGFMTGLGGNAGIGAAINTTAKSFPPSSVCALSLAFMPSTCNLMLVSVALPLVLSCRVSASRPSCFLCLRKHSSREIHLAFY